MQSIQISTLQEIPNQIKKLFKRNNYKILEHSESCNYDFIFSKRNTARFKILLKNNRAKTFKELENLLIEISKYGSKNCEELTILLYGEEQGKIKWEETINAYKIRNSKEGYIQKHGKIDGERKWEEYRKKQSYTNTLEYKNEKYGWSKEQFDDFNKSRSCTKENFIKRYGKEMGCNKWKEYCERQAYTNTKDYLGEKYEEICKAKGPSLKNFQKRYGEELGYIKFNDFFNNLKPFYSKISQELFNEIIKWDDFKGLTCYFAEYNNEYGIYSKVHDRFFKYDFVCIEKKLCIEFHGDHYHGNPKIYKPDEMLKGRGQAGITAKHAWERDEIKKNVIYNERGFDTIIVWESDYNNNKKQILERLRNAIS